MTTTTQHTIQGASRSTAQSVRSILKVLLLDHGITDATMAVGRCSFDPSTSSMSFKVEVSLPTEAGTKAETRQEQELRQNTAAEWMVPKENSLHGHKAGDKFISRGTVYTLTGWNTRARKRPVMCVKSAAASGGTFVFEIMAFTNPLLKWVEVAK